MKWYYIVLVVIGIIAMLIAFAHVHLSLYERKRGKKHEREQQDEDESLLKHHYPRVMAIRVRKDALSRFSANPTPPNLIPLGHNLYRTEEGLIIYCQTPAQVFYYESAYSEQVNSYIIKHYEEISNKLKEEGITFVYMPGILAHIQDSVAYCHPDTSKITLGTYKAEDFYKELAAGIAKNPTEEPLLIVPDFFNNCGYTSKELGENNVGCYSFILNYIDEEQFDFVFQRHLKTIIRNNIVRYSIAKAPCEEDIADYESISKIAQEIQDRINMLYAKGVSEYVISKIVALPVPKLSTLLITEEFLIFLPEYNNMEITMPTLSKVLFFFYMRHPEGVLFKNLRDHKEELFELYRSISPLEDMEKMERSIEDIIDSTKNSVNEKCSRIKAAFVSRFNDRLAKEYYITGGAGEPKRIALDRSLVQDKSGIIK